MNKKTLKNLNISKDNRSLFLSVGGIILFGALFIGTIEFGRLAAIKQTNEAKKLNNPKLNSAVEKLHNHTITFEEYDKIRKEVLSNRNQQSK